MILPTPQAMAPEISGQFPYIGLGCVVLLSGPLLFNVLDGLFVMPILWAGVLIAFSLCAYGTGRPKLGLGLGLAALFIRELALPYCLFLRGIGVVAVDSEETIHSGTSRLGAGTCAHG